MDDKEFEETLDEVLQALDAGVPQELDLEELQEEVWHEKLSEVLDSHRELRDDNFVHPESILVFTVATGALEEVAIWDLPLMFPLAGKGARWSPEDLGEIVLCKSTLYRQSRAANDLAEEHPEATPECGTVCLVDEGGPGTLCWCQVKARIDPLLSR
jgi:hypothetical protein